MTTVAIASLTTGIVLSVYSLLFLFRIILTWNPEVDLKALPFAIAYWPTEFLLAPTRKLIPPFGGVDISPIVWFGIVSLVRELLVGQQGLLKMIG